MHVRMTDSHTHHDGYDEPDFLLRLASRQRNSKKLKCKLGIRPVSFIVKSVKSVFIAFSNSKNWISGQSAMESKQEQRIRIYTLSPATITFI